MIIENIGIDIHIPPFCYREICHHCHTNLFHFAEILLGLVSYFLLRILFQHLSDDIIGLRIIKRSSQKLVECMAHFKIVGKLWLQVRITLAISK